MVEGPKVALKKERLSSLVGLALKSIRILKRGSVNEFDVPKIPELENVEKPTVESVQFVGKELYILFSSNFHFKYHFGMNGSERVVDEVGKDVDVVIFAQSLQPKYSRKQLTAVVEFIGKTAFFYDTTVSVSRADKTALTSSISQRSVYDVMSPTFCGDKVTAKIAQDERVIHTVLLDQTILPGVGNVIKCEGLFRARLHPDTTAKTIPPQQLEALIQHIYDFSWEWYKATKAFRSIKKEVYEHIECSQCHDRIVLVRSGVYHRITFYCPTCQSFSSTQNVSSTIPPTSSASLLSFAPTKPWKCEFCNRLNGADALICEICEEPWPVERTKTENIQSLNNETHSNSSSSSTKRVDSKQFSNRCIHTIQPIRCKCSLPANLQRVRKSGPNMHRLFWVCGKEFTAARNQTKHSKNSSNSCGFVGWADTHFPTCQQHLNVKPILRRVLKECKNNGRYFYTCAATEKCSFFQWDDELPLLPALIDPIASQPIGVLHIPL